MKSEIIKAIVYAILGAVILVAGILDSCGWEILLLGGMIAAISIGEIIFQIVKYKG